MAGGESRRMGRDKATLLAGGDSLWRRQVRTLREAGAGEIIVARAGRAWANEPGLLTVPDAQPGCGPLGGLVAGLRRASGRWTLALAVDMPLMPAGYLRKMITQAESDHCGVAPAIEGRFEPLAAVYQSVCLPLAEDCLSREEWSMQTLLERCVTSGLMRRFAVPENECAYFRNVNTPEDLAEVERHLHAGQA